MVPLRSIISKAGGLALLAIIASSCADQPVQPDYSLPNFSEVAAENEQALNDLHLVLFEENGVPSDFASDVESLGGAVEFSHAVGIAFVSGLSDDAATMLGNDSMIAAVQPNVSIPMDPVVTSDPETPFDEGVHTPDDPTSAYFYGRQWNMRAIKADDAWAAGRTGSDAVKVAILDTGIDYTYPDLNGLVDLDRSASFVSEDDEYVDLFFPDKHHVTDIHYHGTHVAATVASNAYVAAGVTSMTTLMGVKVCSAVLGFCPGDAIVEGVLYAVDNGADVINMSLGGGFLRGGSAGLVGFLNSLFNYAHSKGVTVVVSAGNDGLDLDHYPSLYKTYCDTPNTICVSATGPTSGSYYGPWTDVDAPTDYTNYGRSAINVAAPGGTTAGWVWAACSQTSLVIPVCQTGNYIVGLTGTSMAAPHVSGLAALMVEDYGRNPGRIRTKIQQTADDLGRVGVDPYYGKGRINVANAIATRSTPRRR